LFLARGYSADEAKACSSPDGNKEGPKNGFDERVTLCETIFVPILECTASAINSLPALFCVGSKYPVTIELDWPMPNCSHVTTYLQ
jgi:hypothetical protein